MNTLIRIILVTCSIQSTLGNLSWSIERPYVNNILPPEFTDSTKENKIYPVVVFPDNDPLKIKLSCIKEGYRGNNDPDWTPSNLVGKVIRTVNTTHEYATWTTTITLPSDLAGKRTVRVNYEQGETVKLLEAEFHIYAKTATSGNKITFTQGTETGLPSDEVADEIKKQLESHYPVTGVTQEGNSFIMPDYDMDWNLPGDEYKLIPHPQDADIKIVPIVVTPGESANVTLTCLKKDYDGVGKPSWNMDSINGEEKDFVKEGNVAKWEQMFQIKENDAGIRNVTCKYTQVNSRGAVFEKSITVQFLVFTKISEIKCEDEESGANKYFTFGLGAVGDPSIIQEGEVNENIKQQLFGINNATDVEFEADNTFKVTTSEKCPQKKPEDDGGDADNQGDGGDADNQGGDGGDADNDSGNWGGTAGIVWAVIGGIVFLVGVYLFVTAKRNGT